MGLIKAFSGALGGTFADQWKDVIVAPAFDELTVVQSGVQRSINNGRGANVKGSYAIITNGSRIYVPEHTAAIILSESGIEQVVTESGGYEYSNGQESLFNKDSLKESVVDQTKERFTFGGISPDEKRILYVNLREIRNIKFGTRGPQVYHDRFYDTDLEIKAYGRLSVQITDPVKFVQNFMPANQTYYSFEDEKSRMQLLGEFIQSFITALNTLSADYRISELPGQATAVSEAIVTDTNNTSSWPERYGLTLITVAVENIELTDQSRELIREYSSNKMNLEAYENISRKASDIAAQQKIAEGIKDNGLGDSGNLIFGMGLSSNLGQQAQQHTFEMSFDQQIEAVKKLKELLDEGILTEEEFNTKKKEIMGL